MRISTKKQAKEGDGLRSQSRSLEDYARYKGMEVVEIFSDVISGKYASRPGMDAMLEFLREHTEETYAVLVHDIARLARDIVSHTQLRAEISAAGGVLMSPSIEFSDDPVAQLPQQ
ncbi:MAG: recombinase family protein, partial [Caulobacterales bacterium]|uniref:recombinase family protein n=1 Tax=Glycocaulis sp. TaxID=1969725 RepID=UPI003FA18F94